MKTYWLLERLGRKPLAKSTLPAMPAAPQTQPVNPQQNSTPIQNNTSNSTTNSLPNNVNTSIPNSIPNSNSKPITNSISSSNVNEVQNKINSTNNSMSSKINSSVITKNGTSDSGRRYSPVAFQDVTSNSLTNSPEKFADGSRRGKYSWVKWDQFWK